MYLSNAVECFLLLVTTERRLAQRTITLYTKALVKLEAYARQNGYRRLADLTPNLLRAAASAEMSQGGRDRALNWCGGEAMGSAIVCATRAMLRRLGEEFPELTLPDISMVKTPRIPKRIQPRLEDGEYARLEATLRLRLLRDRVPRFLIARDLAILAVLGNTGLRADELCGMDTSDVDLDEGAVKIRKGKGGHQRILTVRDPDAGRDGGEVVRALADYMRYRERVFGSFDSSALWLTLKGNRLIASGLRRTLSNLCEDAGIDGNRPPHAFRRAYFTEQYRAQPTVLPILVERMGWQSDQMAKVYTRGVELELARRVALPLQSKAWRGGPKVRGTGSSSPAVSNNGVGPPRETWNDPAASFPERRGANRAAKQTSRGGRRHLE